MLILSKAINEDAVSGLRVKAMLLRAEIYQLQGRHELAQNQLEATAKKGGKWGFKAKEKLEQDMAMNELLATIFDYSLNGSIVLLIIGGCSCGELCYSIERMLNLRRAEIDTNSFIIGIRRYLKEGNIADAIQYCEETGGTIGNIVKAGVARHNRQKDQIEHAMELSGLVEISNLEKNAKILSIIAHIAPLIGLLGTVLGFIQAFAEMRTSGLVDISATLLATRWSMRWSRQPPA